MTDSKLKDQLESLSIPEAATRYVNGILHWTIPFMNSRDVDPRAKIAKISAGRCEGWVNSLCDLIDGSSSAEAVILHRALQSAGLDKDSSDQRAYFSLVAQISMMHEILWNIVRYSDLQDASDELSTFEDTLFNLLANIEDISRCIVKCNTECEDQRFYESLPKGQSDAILKWCEACRDSANERLNEVRECRRTVEQVCESLEQNCELLLTHYVEPQPRKIWELHAPIINALTPDATPEETAHLHELTELFKILAYSMMSKDWWELDPPMYSSSMATTAHSAYQKIIAVRKEIELLRDLSEFYLSAPLFADIRPKRLKPIESDGANIQEGSADGESAQEEADDGGSTQEETAQEEIIQEGAAQEEIPDQKLI